MEYLNNIFFDDKVAEVSLSYSQSIRSEDRINVENQAKAAYIFLKTWDIATIDLQECFKIMLLTSQHELLGISTIHKGGMTSCHVDLRLVFATALKCAATSIILAHNHPSGNLTPSENDINLTDRITRIGNVLGIKVIDSFVITKEGFTSIEV